MKYYANIGYSEEKMYLLLNKMGCQEHSIQWEKDLAKGITKEQFANYNLQTMVFKVVKKINGQSKELKDKTDKKYDEDY